MMKKTITWLVKHKWLTLGVIALVGVGAFWWSQQSNNEVRSTVEPTYRNITQFLTVSGRVDAKERARLNFAASSKLMWLPISEGDRVKRWQGLAQVDARQLQKQLEIAQNTHGQTFRTFEQTLDGLDYYSASGLTESERRTAESAQLSIRNTALSAEIANISVTLAFMSSPIEGIVTRIDQKNVGALMLPSDVIEVVNPDSLYFAAIIDEEDISLVSENQRATIILDSFDNQEIESKIIYVAFAPSMSELGGTGYIIWLELPINNADLSYKLGMNGEARIILNQADNVLSVPIDALIERDGVTYVEVMKGTEVEKVEVTIGISDEDYAQIISGLSMDDLVVMPQER